MNTALSPIKFSDSARWIWGRKTDAAYFPANTYWMFRKDIVVDCVCPTELLITASTRYTLWINGEEVGQGPAPSAAKTFYVDRYDLTSRMVSGVNRLAVLVHHAGVPTFNYNAESPGLLAEARINGASVCVTDSTWICARADEWSPYSVKRAFQLVQSEIVDFRRSEQGWQSRSDCLQSLDAQGIGLRFRSNYGCIWTSADQLSPSHSGGISLWERPIPFLERGIPVRCSRIVAAGLIRPVRELADSTHIAKAISNERLESQLAMAFNSQEQIIIPQPPDGFDTVVVLDFGREMTGQILVSGRGSPGSVIDVSVGEALSKTSGLVNPRFPQMLSANYTDRLILGNDAFRWKQFHWTAARYLQLTVRGNQGDLCIDFVGMQPSHYPITQSGSFSCENELLSWAWKTGAYTTQCCLHEVVVDCPLREQAQWIDNVTLSAAQAAFGDLALFRKMLLEIASSEQADHPGCLRIPWPGHMPAMSDLWGFLPDQQAVWVYLIKQYDEYCGDLELIRMLLPVVERVLAFQAQHRNSQGILDFESFQKEKIRPWLWVDWGHKIKDRYSASLNLLHLLAIQSALSLANRLGDQPLVEKFSKEALVVAKAIRSSFIDEKNVCVCEDVDKQRPSQIASTLALLTGILASDQVPKVLRDVCSPPVGWEKGGTHFLGYLFPVLAEHGRHRQILENISILYKEMYDLKVTTFWENFGMGAEIDELDKLTQESRCHAYSASPTAALSAYIAGIRPLEPGFRRAIIDPRFELLNTCECNIPSPLGIYAIRWMVVGDIVECEVTLPIGASGIFWPTGEEFGPGRHVCRLEMAQATANAKNSNRRPAFVPLYDPLIHERFPGGKIS
jgi:hypothetical protein